MGASLLQRVAMQDPAAAEQLLDRYGGLVWSMIRRYGIPDGDREDAAQDVFVDVWKSAGRYRPEAGSEDTFVAMITRRRLIDRIRRLKPEDRPMPDEASQATAAPAAADDLTDDARRALAVLQELPDEQQRVIRLSIVNGVSHDRISSMTGLPLGTVKTHIRRGLLRVRELIELRTVNGKEVSA